MNERDEIERLRERRAQCLPLHVLRATAPGVLSAEHQAMRDEHLRVCPLCRTLAADLQDETMTAPTLEETARIGARLTAARPTIPASRRGLMWRAALGIAAAALFILMIWRPGMRPAAPVDVPPLAAVIPPELRLEMPEISLRASVALATRSGPDARRYLNDLAPAFTAYRSERYGEAAREFATLESNYPSAIEVLFFGAVSSLHEGAAPAAVRSLERARALNEAEFADDVEWYLGLAYHRAGNIDAARSQFAQVCAGQGRASNRACDAVKVLEGAR
jgi:hypothetical protein